MIWYLLYPLRGTTDAPVLSPTHPIRLAFSRYGRCIARHVVATLLVSGLVTTILLYPIPFLFTSDYINGASNLPHHVWTAAQPLRNNAPIEPDVIMRSIWIHADYMQALRSDVLAAALDIQDQILGSTENFDPVRSRGVNVQGDSRWPMPAPQRDALHIANGLTNLSWFFHSPLLYWECSRRKILADEDIISTINDKKNQSTSANVTLRHSIVFSGKHFEERRLLAADALVITLLHRRDSPVGHQWEEIAPSLVDKFSKKWNVYPQSGQAYESQLYEFQFRPISPYDILSLTLAYGLTLAYFLASLTKLRAIKSKAGLTLTVVTQIAISILTSFTICAIFDIDLSRIPRASYPIVVLAMSLENIFRLINAVILTPSEESSSSRVGQAFGQTAHIALASTIQNVGILIGLSKVVSPGVSSFCIFAAVAISFDFLYLSTFFLSVLSVDVRRMELGEALSRASMHHDHNLCDVETRSRWIVRAWRTKVALSTRIAGTIVMVGFVLAAQGHFFGYKTMLNGGRGSLGASEMFEGATPSFLEEIHQARSPASWLRLQDHETAQEVIRAIKPSDDKYSAKVFEPLIFVLKNSDRIPPPRKPRFLPAVYDFVHHQMAQFVATIILVGAALCLLTNYLLWADDEDSNEASGELDKRPLLSSKTLSGGHSLDVAMIVSSPGGYLVSAGLDRKIWVWDVRPGGTHYSIPGTEVLDGCGLFPVLGMAVDDDSKLVAVLSAKHVRMWNLAEYTWSGPFEVDRLDHRPEMFCFDPESTKGIVRLVIVRRNGIVTELAAQARGTIQNFTACPEQVADAQVLICETYIRGKRSRELKALLVSANGRAFIISRSTASREYTSLPVSGIQDNTLHQAVPLSPLALFLVGAATSVYLVSADDGSIQHTFATEPMIPLSFRCNYTYTRIKKHTRAAGLSSLTMGYNSRIKDAVLMTFVPSPGSEAIAAHVGEAPSSGAWCTWEEASETKKRLEDPGVWDIVQDGSAVGIRRRSELGVSARQSSLRYRGSGMCVSSNSDMLKYWQMWTILDSERFHIDESRPLLTDSDAMAHLLIPHLGPKARVGLRSVAFAFGNVVKIVNTGGQERYDCAEDASNDALLPVGNRRRRLGGSTQSRVSM